MSTIKSMNFGLWFTLYNYIIRINQYIINRQQSLVKIATRSIVDHIISSNVDILLSGTDIETQ